MCPEVKLLIRAMERKFRLTSLEKQEGIPMDISMALQRKASFVYYITEY